MESKNELLGKRLRYLRNKSGKNQEVVANDIGISRARYSHYENNHVEPDIYLIRKMAAYYNVTTDYLLGVTDNPEKEPNNKRDAIIHKIATEFPEIDLMFHDLANMTAEDLEDIYDYIKFKSQKKE